MKQFEQENAANPNLVQADFCLDACFGANADLVAWHNVRKLGTKRQVKVAAHVSVQVIHNSAGKILKIVSDSLENRSFEKC